MGIEVPPPFYHGGQHGPNGPDPVLGIEAADLDSAIQFWDDPLGIGYASPFPPFCSTNQSTFSASRAVYARAISGGVMNFLRFRVFAQSGNLDFGIFANTGVGAAARPGAKIWSSGSFACPPVGEAVLTVSPAVTVKARDHWFAFSPDNATASLYQFLAANAILEGLAGWGAFKDTSFPLPASAGAVTNGYFRFPFCAGRAT